jgi:hypothetical protein
MKEIEAARYFVGYIELAVTVLRPKEWSIIDHPMGRVDSSMLLKTSEHVSRASISVKSWVSNSVRPSLAGRTPIVER